MKKKKSYFKLRVFAVIGFFLALFAAVFLRAFDLQVLKSRSLMAMAMRQHSKTVSIQPKRGEIYDRNFKELAVSVEVDSIFARPGQIESPGAAARTLSRALSIDRWELEKKLKSSNNFVWLKRQIDLNEGQRDEIKSIEGIGITKESRRYYPNRQLASNLIGFTGLDSNGLEGVEFFYDNMLKGSSHKFVGDKDARGSLLIFEDIDKKAPAQGMVVELTIDKTIQFITEKALKQAVSESSAKGGIALVMDPNTGEILSMATAPTFDPNAFNNFAARQRRNRPVVDAFEPGSIMKPFLISAALEENVIKPADNFFCENGSYRVADRVIHDAKSYGWLTVPQVIKYSSNIGASKIGEKLGRVQLYRYLKAYGFGAKTGIDLPGESSGLIRNYKTWSNVTIETISFGQGASVTGLQLVTALSAIANHGFLMKPYIVKSIKDPNGKVISESNPSIVRRVISEDTARKVTDMLVGVTQPGGTGVRAALDDFEVAGKTGTAQKPDFRNGGYTNAFVSSFFGFVPARDPRLVILVVLDEPRGDYHGGAVAAPVFKNIAEQSLSYMGVFPRNAPKVRLVKSGKAQESPKAEDSLVMDAPDIKDEDRPMAVPDFTGKTVRSVLKIAKARSFDVDIIGSGKAVSQKPASGENISEKEPVSVWFR